MVRLAGFLLRVYNVERMTGPSSGPRYFVSPRDRWCSQMAALLTTSKDRGDIAHNHDHPRMVRHYIGIAVAVL